jgi:SAM-dependent methyltransferase
MKELALSLVRILVPASTRRWLRACWRGQPAPRVGAVKFGSLGRLTPFSYHFGYDRGQPIDRYYIEKFLQDSSPDIQGRVLEIGDRSYTRCFGGDHVTVSDVLHVSRDSPQATIIGDLTRADNIPSDCFDCIILTQTLHLIYDVRSAIQTVHRILKPGGVALVTFPGITQISSDQWRTTWYWSFTSLSAQRMFCEVFPSENLSIKAFGNVLTASSFLYGIAAQELDSKTLNTHDPHYELLITVRAVKPPMEENRTDE